MEDNSLKQIKLRQARNTLVVVGTGIIIMSAWTVIKSFSLTLFERDNITAAIREMGEETMAEFSDKEVFAVFCAVLCAVTLIFIGIRVYIGLSAISEGKDKKSGSLYIPLTVVYIGITIYQIILQAMDLLVENDDFKLEQPSAAAILIELTSLIMLTEMIIAAVRVKKYRNETRREEADAA